MTDEAGKYVIRMESGSHLYPVKMSTDYNHCVETKPSERMVVTKAGSDELKLEGWHNAKSHILSTLQG